MMKSSEASVKVPIFKCEPETIQYQNALVQYIRKVFITKYGEGSRGVWEYAKSVNPDSVFLNVILVTKTESGELVTIVK